ncbi:MAG: CRISPR-associated endonuclease Cas2 [Candidatus Zambryskibacteria bacterium]|nr:CRISPR-associated endonuclease Cas2 [Candidatus Zambryskibacteria bacterium]
MKNEKLEDKAKNNTRKTRIQEAILLTLASGGRLGGDILIKRVLNSLLGTDFDNDSPRRWDTVRTAASRLSKKGLLMFESGHYSPTQAGAKILREWELSDYKIKIPKKWDKKWRVIIFDIPEKKKKTRDKVREILIAAGFQRLQNSVWVYPYDCEDVIGLMKNELGIGKYLLYMIVEQLENDRFLRMDFDLIR